MKRIEMNIDINRAEGDLEIALSLEGNRVVEARTVGNLYRGFEQILIGRSPRDAMVITPRVCGICGTAHLYTSTLALEHAWQLPVPPNASRIRNLCLFVEGMLSDLRQTFLYFAADFCHAGYQKKPWFIETKNFFEPFKGEIYLETLAITRDLVGIVALFGGQWPHSSYMLPGGVVAPPEPKRLLAVGSILDKTQQWYEKRVMGMELDAWLELHSAEAYFAKLQENAHASSALGLLSRACRDLKLHELGKGTQHMLSYGTGCNPELWTPGGSNRLLAGGVFNADNGQIESLNQLHIAEHVRYSWFKPYPGGRHPYEGETIPDYQPWAPPYSDRYTWAKAPRYDEKVMQTGPLAELIIGGDLLLRNINALEGSGAWLRQFARIRRVGYELRLARQMLNQLTLNLDDPHYFPPPAGHAVDGEGFGMLMAARGALGHWLKIADGKIAKYQIITPTAWNASPRDSFDQAGHWELSLVGLEIADLEDPIEVEHIIRSHDPCMVCTVHMVKPKSDNHPSEGKRLVFEF